MHSCIYVFYCALCMGAQTAELLSISYLDGKTIAPAVAVQSTLVAELTHKLHGIFVYYVDIVDNFTHYNVGCTRRFPRWILQVQDFNFPINNNNHDNYFHNTTDGECDYGRRYGCE